jgi:prolyl-tRNA editing enzyme YbaK/EbsC (Cys-tRNA(Pro) deacylase)
MGEMNHGGARMADESPAEVERVRRALRAADHPDTIKTFDQSTHTAAEAAAAIGCAPGQIAKSIVFRIGDTPVLVIASGPNRISLPRISKELGQGVSRADPDFVREKTGFAPGGVPPIAHATAPVTLLDEDLLAFDTIWAAAGSPAHVFQTTAAELMRLSAARSATVKD